MAIGSRKSIALSKKDVLNAYNFQIWAWLLDASFNASVNASFKICQSTCFRFHPKIYNFEERSPGSLSLFPLSLLPNAFWFEVLTDGLIFFYLWHISAELRVTQCLHRGPLGISSTDLGEIAFYFLHFITIN
jgi:hypothetical protein